MHSQSRAAFTLIELLVVLGIIALLIGILLPVLSSAKQAAVKTHCAAQVRQVAVALEVYGNDFKESYPVAGSKIDWGQVDPTTNLPSWMEQMFVYLPSQEVLSGCHAYPRDTPYHYFLSTRAAWEAQAVPDSLKKFMPVKRLRIKRTSQFVLAGDNNWDFNEVPTPDADKDDYTQNTLALQADANHWAPQHDNGLNIVFADSHVASFTELDPDAMTWRYDTMSLW